MKSEHNFFYSYRKMYRPYINKLNVFLAKFHLYSAQWGVLSHLVNEGPYTLVEISNHLHVEKPSVTRLVKRLGELGYVHSVQGKDKREKIIYPTELGKKVVEEIESAIEEFYKDSLRGISEKDLLLVSKVLTTVRNNLLE